MLETWLEKREWERLKERLPRGYEWEIQLVRRKNRKGRVIGGMVIGIRNGVVVLEEEEQREMEKIMMKVVKIGGERRIIGKYINSNMKEILMLGWEIGEDEWNRGIREKMKGEEIKRQEGG